MSVGSMEKSAKMLARNHGRGIVSRELRTGLAVVIASKSIAGFKMNYTLNGASVRRNKLIEECRS